MNRFYPALKLVACHLILVAICFLAACSPQADVLPTPFDLNALSTNDAATGQAQTAVAVNTTATRIADATRNAPATLPPTWTASPPPTEPPAEASLVPPTAVAATGTIYYIFNDDSIAMLNADGSHEELLIAGTAPADLVLSPDGQTLAFTQRVSDTVREVFVMSLKTDGVPADQQYKPAQVSCLGFANVVHPTWSADSRSLTYAASKAANGPLGVYIAEAAGPCPQGSHERGLVQTQFKAISSMAWDPNGKFIYLASGSLYAVDASKGTLYPPLTMPTGYGPDSDPLFRPDTTTLYYLKQMQDDQSPQVGGLLAQVDPTSLETLPLQEQRGTMLLADQFHFSPDGRYLVASGKQVASVQNMDVGSAVMIVQDAKLPPQAVFSPDAERVAYVSADAGTNPIPQIWVVNRGGTGAVQLTHHTEGTISDMNWAAQ